MFRSYTKHIENVLEAVIDTIRSIFVSLTNNKKELQTI